MKKMQGFTLIELILFIVITTILASAILIAYIGAMGKSSTLLQNTIATATARQCADWFLSQRRLNGFAAVSGTNCTASMPTPSLCSIPSGYSLTVDCTQTTLGSDNNYVTITVTVSGAGSTTLTLLLGDY